VSRDTGFAIADIDSGLFSDPKVVALARRLHDAGATAAHVALYEALVLGSWGSGDRLTFEEALPAWWMEDASEVRANLTAVGLLGEDGRIPAKAWEAWFRPAWDRREARRAKGRLGGLAKAGRRSITRSTARPQGNSARPVPDRAGISDRSDRPDYTDSSGRPLPTANAFPPLHQDAVQALEDATGRSWSFVSHASLTQYACLVRDHGLDDVQRAFAEVLDGESALPPAYQLITSATRILEPIG